MQYIDSHVHFWDLKNNINDWVLKSNDKALLQDINIDKYLSHLDKPEGIVTIEAANSSRTLEEVKWINNTIVSNTHNIKIKHFAYIDITANPESFIVEVDKFKKFDFVIGFRDIQAYSEICKYSPRSEDITKSNKLLDLMRINLNYLAAKNYIFDCQMFPDQLIRASETILTSNAKIVIDHLALPSIYHDFKDEWLNALKLYGSSKIKLSGLDFGNKKSEEIIDICLNEINIDNLVFGSNFPCTNLEHIKQSISLLKNKLNINELTSVIYKNAYAYFEF